MTTSPIKHWARAKKFGYRSGLEKIVQDSLNDRMCFAQYEAMKIEWEDLAYRTYTPDFLLPNGIIIETKGMFTVADRRKHTLIKKQHPELDIRFVFENSKRRISKASKTTYAAWCEKHGFLYADKLVPDAWIQEEKKLAHPPLVKFKGTKKDANHE